MALFRCRGWRQILRSPFGLDTMTRALTQSVGFSTCLIISRSTMRFSSVLSFGLRAKGTFLTGVITGSTSFLIPMWWMRVKQPISPKQSENSSWIEVVNWTFLEIWYVCFIKFNFTDVFSPRMGTESESTTINKTFTVRSLSFSLPMHLSETGMDVPLYAENLIVASLILGLGENFWRRCFGITLHWAPVSILNATSAPFCRTNGKVIQGPRWSLNKTEWGYFVLVAHI